MSSSRLIVAAVILVILVRFVLRSLDDVHLSNDSQRPNGLPFIPGSWCTNPKLITIKKTPPPATLRLSAWILCARPTKS